MEPVDPSKKHFYISLVKSALRLLGCYLLWSAGYVMDDIAGVFVHVYSIRTRCSRSIRYCGGTLMGPYSEERQTRRAELIASVLVNKVTSPEVKRIWEQHLANLATTEQQYNARVASLYGDKKWNQSIGTLLPTL
jgi:hypothetical protein